MGYITENIQEVERQILEVCTLAGRSVDEVTLIAVTKTKPISDLQEAAAYGLKYFGENKVQEITDKYPAFNESIHWHMIGHLQTNKVKYIVGKVDLIHSVDSLRLATKINEEAAKRHVTQNILLQVNIAEEDTKFGIKDEEVEALVRDISLLSNVRLKGLMLIAPFVENPEDNRPIFRRMKQIFVDINCKNIDNVCMDTLSMGMTNDYKVAISEGSTMVRIGTAIFGERNYDVEG